MDARVSQYLRSTLEGEKLLREPMDENCAVTVLFPVHAEPIRRILELLESVSEQKDIAHEKIEVLCLVGNDVRDGSKEREKILRANQLILELPVWKNARGLNGQRFSDETRARAALIREKLNAYAIDKSTPGEEIEACNVGKARNRLLAEAVHRYSRWERSGVLIMTDADTTFANPLHIQTVLKFFIENKNFVAGAGGVDYVFDPDTQTEVQRERIHEAFSNYVLTRRWNFLSNYLLHKPVNLCPADACFGGNIVCSSEAAAACGGFRPIGRLEDSYFFRDISVFAERAGLTAAALPHLRVNAALRDSFRTDSSFGHVLHAHRHLPIVKHPFTGSSTRLSDKLFRDLAMIAGETEDGRVFLRRLESLPQVMYDDAFCQDR